MDEQTQFNTCEQELLDSVTILITNLDTDAKKIYGKDELKKTRDGKYEFPIAGIRRVTDSKYVPITIIVESLENPLKNFGGELLDELVFEDVTLYFGQYRNRPYKTYKASGFYRADDAHE